MLFETQKRPHGLRRSNGRLGRSDTFRRVQTRSKLARLEGVGDEELFDQEYTSSRLKRTPEVLTSKSRSAMGKKFKSDLGTKSQETDVFNCLHAMSEEMGRIDVAEDKLGAP